LQLGARAPQRQVLIGFAADHGETGLPARGKAGSERSDLIVFNDVSEKTSVSTPGDEVVLVSAAGERRSEGAEGANRSEILDEIVKLCRVVPIQITAGFWPAISGARVTSLLPGCSLGCERVRPLAWSATRNSAALLEGTSDDPLRSAATGSAPTSRPAHRHEPRRRCSCVRRDTGS